MTCSGARGKKCAACPNRYVHDYLAVSENIIIKPSTADTYRDVLRLYDDYLGDCDVRVLDAKREDVVNYIESWVGKGNRLSTLEVKLQAINNLYRHIRLRMDDVTELALDPIVLETIDLGKYNTPEPIEREALSREELRKLFDSMTSYRNRLLTATGAETGLRNSDLREIQISDIDFEILEIHVPDSKGSKAYEVPISNELAFELRQWLDHHRGAYAAASKSKYLFPSETGPKLETNASLNEIIKDAATKAGIQDVIGTSQITPEQRKAIGTEKETREMSRVTVHTLRHTFLTLLKKAGVPLAYRQLVANHSNPETTRGYEDGPNDIFENVRDKFDPPTVAISRFRISEFSVLPACYRDWLFCYS